MIGQPPPPYRAQTIRGTACPMCELTVAHHVNCPVRLEGAPKIPIYDPEGNEVTGERRPVVWSKWEKAEGPLRFASGTLGPLPSSAPHHIRAWSRWRLKMRLVAISALEWVLHNGKAGWQYHLTISLLDVPPSRASRLPQELEVQAALGVFGLSDAEEETAQPEYPIRNFWAEVNPETTIKETTVDPNDRT